MRGAIERSDRDLVVEHASQQFKSCSVRSAGFQYGEHVSTSEGGRLELTCRRGSSVRASMLEERGGGMTLAATAESLGASRGVE
jgi:hypothetical protein